MAKYGKTASKRVASAVKRQKAGTLKSSSGQTVKSRKQAIAIGLSEAREKVRRCRRGSAPPKSANRLGTHQARTSARRLTQVDRCSASASDARRLRA